MLKKELEEMRGINSSKGSEVEILMKKIKEKEEEIHEALIDITGKNKTIEDLKVIKRSFLLEFM